MEKIKVMIVGNNDNRIYEIKSLLRNDKVAFIGFAKQDDSVLDKAISLKPHVIIIQSDDDYQQAIALAEKIYIRIPGCAVILLCDRFDVSMIEKVMLAGIRKVLQFPIDAESLTENIELAHYMEKSRLENADVTTANNL